ncbi:hypothetical protein R2103_02725 [Nitrosomonas sp. Is24]|uniref:hypothetical protein n=1 Tax=Nitrosomonas sp. Is24 TaxID=3080533 RepID=UPI00294AB288|nr:hypothetical protein [Nitrosomonas sp. Is24]MDV6340681.1 hypothetical protein [Nitrosomonas sp. Is24]
MLRSYIEHINRRFPGDGLCKKYREELARVCDVFIKSGFADSKFLSELTSGSNTKFWSCISEALIFEQIKHKELIVCPPPGIGPDFLLHSENRNIWIEVICPEPTKVPKSWLNIQPNLASKLPHNEILQHWTSAIKEKKEKLLGAADRKKEGWLSKGIVSNSDVYVIAVNGCQMRHGPFLSLHGISGFPYAIEAVFAIGPRQLTIDKEKLLIISSGHQERFTIENLNGASVPTDSFLDQSNTMISAIWAVDFNASKISGNQESSALIHNPYAKNPLPRSFLPCDEEYVATLYDDSEQSQVELIKFTKNSPPLTA